MKKDADTGGATPKQLWPRFYSWTFLYPPEEVSEFASEVATGHIEVVEVG